MSSVLCGGEADLPPNVPSAVPKVPSPAVVLGSRLTPTHPQGPSQWAHVSGTLAPPAGEGKPLLTCRGHRGSRGGHGRSSAPQQLPLGSSQVHFPKAGVPRGVTAVAPGPFHQTGVHPQKLLTLLSSVMGRKASLRTPASEQHVLIHSAFPALPSSGGGPISQMKSVSELGDRPRKLENGRESTFPGRIPTKLGFLGFHSFQRVRPGVRRGGSQVAG